MGAESSNMRDRTAYQAHPSIHQSEQKCDQSLHSESKSDQPPSYSTSINNTKSQKSTTKPIIITAESIPQWKWTNMQCKLWLTATLSEMMGLSHANATEFSVQFHGCGRTLWHKTVQVWVEWLGWDIGQAMHSLMPECYDARAGSGIPESVTINQFVRPKITSDT